MSEEANLPLLQILKDRFQTHKERHPDATWSDIEEQIKNQPDLLSAVTWMEESGGEPDLVLFGKDPYYCDCVAESPKGRRSLCYDEEALKARKKHKPKGSAMALTEEMQVTMLNEEQYRKLQETGEFDRKTSSWILTPPEIRDKGGALFCDRRYGAVFTYHNGAESYYASRGFRSCIKL